MVALRKFKIEWGMVAAIFTLAWPTMLQELMQTAVQYIDTAMVGALGTDATAAVGSTTTVNWLVSTSISALGIGFLSFVARSIGAGKRNDAARASAQSVYWLWVFSLLLSPTLSARLYLA